MEQHIKESMNNHNIPGLAIAIAKGGDLIYKQGFGVRDIEEQLPVTPETVFGTASLTKSFTARAIMQLDEAGLLSVHDSVLTYIPELHFKTEPPFSLEAIKIHHLLSHSTGLAPVERREDLTRLEDHVEYLSSLDVFWLGSPGKYFSYSNDMFLLLGLIIERVTGGRFREYITEHILLPLDMMRTTLSLDKLETWDNVTVPYNYEQTTDIHWPTPWSMLGNYEVGGGIRSSVIDMITYGQSYLEQPKLLEKMATYKVPIIDNQSYGFGLQITEGYAGMNLFEHSGGQPGVSSHMIIIPEQELVGVVLANVGGTPISHLCLSVVNRMLDLPWERQKFGDKPIDISDVKLVRLAGTYQSDEGDRLTMTSDRGWIYGHVDGERFPLVPIAENILLDTEYNLPIKFFFKKDSDRPWAVLFGMRMLMRQR